MKFNSENVSKSAAKTAKMHDMARNGKVLFDFSDIRDSIPEWVLEKVQAQVMEKDSSIFSDFSMVTYADHDAGILYSVFMEFHRYSVYDNAKNKRVYAIKSAYAMRLAGYRMNAYGIVPHSALPEIYVESGRWTEFEYPIMQIELN